MEEITIGSILTYAAPAISIAMGYWLLTVRDRILVLENDYKHLKTDLEAVKRDSSEVKEDIAELKRLVGELIVALKAKGVINGQVKTPD